MRTPHIPVGRTWQAGRELVDEIFRLTTRLPDREVYGLAGALRRAAVGVSTHLSLSHDSGLGRVSRTRHLSRAHEHLTILRALLAAARRRYDLTPEQLGPALALAEQLESPAPTPADLDRSQPQLECGAPTERPAYQSI